MPVSTRNGWPMRAVPGKFGVFTTVKRCDNLVAPTVISSHVSPTTAILPVTPTIRIVDAVISGFILNLFSVAVEIRLILLPVSKKNSACFPFNRAGNKGGAFDSKVV